MASNLNEILDNFDFTDSIVTEVKWADNLLDLVVIVDYYWDIQDGKDDTRLLKLIFKDCVKSIFQISKEILPFSVNETNINSCFTIVLFKEKTNSELLNEYNLPYTQKHIEIFTTNYSKPWLSVLCSEVLLEEK